MVVPSSMKSEHSNSPTYSKSPGATPAENASFSLEFSCPESVLLKGLLSDELNTLMQSFGFPFTDAMCAHLLEVLYDPKKRCDAGLLDGEMGDGSRVAISQRQIWAVGGGKIARECELGISGYAGEQMPFLAIRLKPSGDRDDARVDVLLDWDRERMQDFMMGNCRWDPLRYALESLEGRELPESFKGISRKEGEQSFSVQLDDRTFLRLTSYEEREWVEDEPLSQKTVFKQAEPDRKARPTFERDWTPTWVCAFNPDGETLHKLCGILDAEVESLERDGLVKEFLEIVREEREFDPLMMEKFLCRDGSYTIERERIIELGGDAIEFVDPDRSLDEESGPSLPWQATQPETIEYERYTIKPPSGKFLLLFHKNHELFDPAKEEDRDLPVMGFCLSEVEVAAVKDPAPAWAIIRKAVECMEEHEALSNLEKWGVSGPTRNAMSLSMGSLLIGVRRVETPSEV